MKMLVLGAGGIGGYFGGRLAAAGVDITFLVRPARREQLVRDGLRIESPLGDLVLPVQTVTADDVRPLYDVVLLTSKAYDLDSAMQAIAPAMGRNCCVLPLLNGMAHFARLDERFGRQQVLGGTCMISVALLPDGVIRHAAPMQRFVFGERDRSAITRTQSIANALQRTTLDWDLSQDINQELWEKLVMLSTLASMTCLFRGNVREIMAAPGGREAVERALDANIAVATQEGHAPRQAAVAFARSGLTDPAGTWTSSMLRDIEAGNAVESDHIVGWMLERARAHHLDDAMLSLAYAHLKAYEARRAASRLPGMAAPQR